MPVKPCRRGAGERAGRIVGQPRPQTGERASIFRRDRHFRGVAPVGRRLTPRGLGAADKLLHVGLRSFAWGRPRRGPTIAAAVPLARGEECASVTVVVERSVVLVVDDQAVVARLVRDVLRARLPDRNLEVVETGSGEAALRWAAAVRPAVIVTDVLMPGAVDGIELIRRLKADPATAAIPVLALSGDPEALTAAAAAGAAAVLAKPFRTAELAAAVRPWLA